MNGSNVETNTQCASVAATTASPDLADTESMSRLKTGHDLNNVGAQTAE